MLVLGDPRPWGGHCEAHDIGQAVDLLRHERVIGLQAGAAEQAEGLLSTDERVRAEAIRVPALRGTFAAVHAALRGLLAVCLDRPVSDVLSFQNGPFGRPRLSGRERLCFSISYRPGIAAVALADQPVGIDVERMRPDLDVAGISQRFFTLPERQHLLRAAGQDRLLRFFELWTRKEALVKAAGVGVNGLADASTLESMARLRDESGVERTFCLRQIQAAAGYAMALAVQCAQPNQGATPP